MSDMPSTDRPVENNDLTAPSVPAETSAMPGQGKENLPTDQPLEQAESVQDPFADENVPESSSLPFNAQDWDAFKTLARELNLSTEQVNKLLAFETSCAAHKAQADLEQKHQQSATWARETKALYGAGLEQEIAFALRAANTFGGPALRTLLEETGLGNHPVVIRTLSGIGRTISEDTCPGGTPSAPQDKTFAEALYGKRN